MPYLAAAVHTVDLEGNDVPVEGEEFCNSLERKLLTRILRVLDSHKFDRLREHKVRPVIADHGMGR